MIYAFIREECLDMPVAVACRVMNVSTSGYYQRGAQPVTAKEADDAAKTETIRQIRIDSHRSYGAPRVHAEPVLARQQRCSRQRVERLMRAAEIQGIYRRRRRHGHPAPTTRTEPDDRSLRSRVGLHVMAVREPRSRCRPSRIDGLNRRSSGWNPSRRRTAGSDLDG